MQFQQVSAEDGRWARELLEASNPMDCEYSFVNIYMWSKVYYTRIARFEDFVIARSEMGRNRLQYLFPAGKGDVGAAVKAILQDAKSDGRIPTLYSLKEKDAQWLQESYPGKFRIEKPMGEADYIYKSADLASLAGKRFQKKRNHCSYFEREYPDWEFFEITQDSVEEVLKFNDYWCHLYDNEGNEGIEEEQRVIALACAHYDELKLKGGYIRANGGIVAFSFGSELGQNMFVTHVEKALYDTRGAYPIINREMARRFCEGYTYINRENDVDEPGLREAKMSYHPEKMTEKYTAELIV